MTSEPARPAFVLHDHRRPAPHFDLRLEENGVLRSWALPKGLPTDPSVNRLAVEVADHAMEHLTYTDADKSIADIGWWEEHDRNERRLIFTLHGQGEPQRYALIRAGARASRAGAGGPENRAGSGGRQIRSDQNWLLHRMKDA